MAREASRPSVTSTTKEQQVTVWLVAFIVALEIGALAVVGYGLAGRLGEQAGDDADDSTP
jgi:hypothetical protein